MDLTFTPLEILNNTLLGEDKIEEVLNVILVISNICEFKRRYQLFNEFIERNKNNNQIKLYVVELAYGNQEFKITDSNNPLHLQLRTKHPLWHKENLINVGIKKLLPEDWKAVAWIDADIEFDNPNWANDTLKVLTKFDIVQLFITCMNLKYNKHPYIIWQSFGYKYIHNKNEYYDRGINMWHPGYAWACTRNYYDRIGGLYQNGLLGGGDDIMARGFIKKNDYLNKLTSLTNNINEFINKYGNVKLGYVPSNIKHYYHGSRENRKYVERKYILLKYNYDPNIHLEYDENGIIIPSKKMSNEFLKEIKDYFFQRNEDECLINK